MPKVAFAGPKLGGCCGLVPKRGICGTNVGGLLWFGVKKRHLWDQSWGVAVVWCSKVAFAGPKVLATPLASASASGSKLLRKLSPGACSASFVPMIYIISLGKIDLS